MVLKLSAITLIMQLEFSGHKRLRAVGNEHSLVLQPGEEAHCSHVGPYKWPKSITDDTPVLKTDRRHVVLYKVRLLWPQNRDGYVFNSIVHPFRSHVWLSTQACFACFLSCCLFKHPCGCALFNVYQTSRVMSILVCRNMSPPLCPTFPLTFC